MTNELQGGNDVNNFQKGMFDKIQKNTNIRPEEVYKVADSVKKMQIFLMKKNRSQSRTAARADG